MNLSKDFLLCPLKIRWTKIIGTHGLHYKSSVNIQLVGDGSVTKVVKQRTTASIFLSSWLVTSYHVHPSPAATTLATHALLQTPCSTPQISWSHEPRKIMQELGKHGRDLREGMWQERRKPLGKDQCPLVFKTQVVAQLAGGRGKKKGFFFF